MACFHRVIPVGEAMPNKVLPVEYKSKIHNKRLPDSRYVWRAGLQPLPVTYLPSVSNRAVQKQSSLDYQKNGFHYNALRGSTHHHSGQFWMAQYTNGCNQEEHKQNHVCTMRISLPPSQKNHTLGGWEALQNNEGQRYLMREVNWQMPKNCSCKLWIQTSVGEKLVHEHPRFLGVGGEQLRNGIQN